ncbi:CRISPR-associated Cas3 family helicase [Psychrobacillus insolitus]|uniref:CRISPR-associated Cas3 family helicase n=2 Tax=Psychrobacillus insolitus TaxID=1461 RepID=A0A2W7MIX1_9BACI|nr:CRISPR-associated Cas3 family helicase [Psychrobacillus insolitus]
MMFDELLAKSESKGNQAEMIWGHTNQLLIRYNSMKNLYPNILHAVDWDLLQLACYYHDVGKANTKFQNKLRKKEERIKDVYSDVKEIPHGYLSCAFVPIKELLQKHSESEVKLLLKAIYYHHERDKEVTEDSKLIVKNDLISYTSMLVKQGFENVEVPKFHYGKFVKKESMNEEELYNFVKIKGLLNKLDFAASAHIDAEIAPDNLVEKLDLYLKKYGRNELQEYLYERQHQSHVIIGSTGIGKTEAALYWIGDSKGIFTLPLKVSINAIYDRLISKIGYKTVGLLHSDTVSEYVKRREDNEFDLTLVHQTKQFSNPLTICTLDQIVDFVGLYPGFEMKLAVLSYSKLVIDEIQMYSPKLAAFIVLGLKHITSVGGKFLIMTATFPPLIGEALQKLGIHREPPKMFLKLDENNQPIIRHFMEIREKDLDIEDVLQEGVERKVLIIVNTVKKAQELYSQCKLFGIRAEVLHSRFINEDRARKEARIIEMGKLTCEKKGIWITTQVVEASVDIDFDVLFTELSEAAGLFQRMGRVFRNRIYKLNKPNVFVYTGEPLPSGISATSKKSVVDYTIYKKSKEVLLKYNNGFVSEKEKIDIVDAIYSREALEGSEYLKEFDEIVQQYLNTLAYETKDKPKLRDIQNENIIPESVYRQYENEIQQIEIDLKDKKVSWSQKIELLTQLKEYVVNIPTWAYRSAKEKGLINMKIEVDQYNNYPVVQFKYTSEQGLMYEIDSDAGFM